MQLGPFHFTPDISIGAILTMLGIAFTCVKYFRHFISDIQIRNERLDQMWIKFNGDEHNEGWDKRFDSMEKRVNEIWDRLYYNRISINEARERFTDLT